MQSKQIFMGDSSYEINHRLIPSYTEDDINAELLDSKYAVISNNGAWKACSFLLGFQFLDIMLYTGISSTLVIYLTEHLGESTYDASLNVNIWVGLTWIVPVFSAYIADAHLGRFWTFVFFSIFQALGLIILAISVWIPSSSTNVQVIVFYIALYLLGLGIGGTKPNISTFAADQFDDNDEKEKQQKASFFNWWTLSLFLGAFFAVTLIVYIQDNIGYEWGYGILGINYMISMGIFTLGIPFYRHKPLRGNPLCEVTQVVVAACRKRRLPTPSNLEQLHELDSHFYTSMSRSQLPITGNIRFLDKAAINDSSKMSGPWSLCPVTQVEEAKLVLKLIPVWLFILIPVVMTSQVNTLFVKEATMVDRQICSGYTIPAGSLLALPILFDAFILVIYDRFLVRLLKRFTGLERGISLPVRTIAGMGLLCLSMVAAAIADAKRMSIVKEEGLSNDPTAVAPVSVLIFGPQLLLLSLSEVFLQPALTELFYEGAPERLRSTSSSLLYLSSGVGSFLSSIILSVVNGISSRFTSNGEWVQDNLNSSNLYYYYAFLAALGSLNLVLFAIYLRN